LDETIRVSDESWVQYIDEVLMQRLDLLQSIEFLRKHGQKVVKGTKKGVHHDGARSVSSALFFLFSSKFPFSYGPFLLWYIFKLRIGM